MELRADLSIIHNGIKNGLNSYIIIDPLDDSHYELEDTAYRIITQMQFCQSIEELKVQLHKRSIHASEMDIANTISYLKSNKLLDQSDSSHAPPKGQVFSKILKAYMHFDIPLLNRDKIDKCLHLTEPFYRLIFNRIMISIAILIAMTGYLLLCKNIDTFILYTKASISHHGATKIVLAIFVTKFLHEVSHIVTARVLSVPVYQAGISFFFFLPRLYSDMGSSPWEHPKSTRIKIASAGILTEVILGGFASFYLLSTPFVSELGLVMYSFIAVNLISTFLMNANPFMRFDGYHIAAELLNEKDLYTEGSNAAKSFFRNLLWGIPRAHKYSLTISVYGILCFFYKIFLYSLFVFIIYEFSIKAIAILLALVEVYIFFLLPMYREAKWVLTNLSQISHAHVILGTASIVIPIMYLILPIPHDLVSPAIVADTSHKVRAKEAGFLKEIKTTDNTMKITLLNNDLMTEAKLADLEYQRAQTKASYYLSMGEFAAYKSWQSIVDKLQIVTDSYRHKITNLSLEADGLILERKEDLIKYYNKGDHICSLFNNDDVAVYGYITEEQKEFLKDLRGKLIFKGEEIPIFLHKEDISDTPVKVLSEVQLSNLSDLNISIPIDSKGKPLEPHYKIKITLPNNNKIDPLRRGILVFSPSYSIAFNLMKKFQNIMKIDSIKAGVGI